MYNKNCSPNFRKLWSVFLGNLFEHYDTALFGFLSPFLAPLIFPEKDPLTALILTYAIIPIGMLTRPLGSLVFGYIGDVYGRNYALFLTLLGMAFISGCIAMTPTYLQAGIFASILFGLGRAVQNFLAGGEVMGGAIYLLENSSEKHHDLLSSLYSTSTMGGHLLASLGVFLLSQYAIIDPGWRFLYLCGCVTALFGCKLRQPSNEMPSAKVKLSQTITHWKKDLWTYRKPFLCIVMGSGFTYANYSIALVLMNGFIPLVTSLTKTEVMEINTYMLLLDICALPFFGWLASKIPREIVMLTASLGVVLLSVPLFLLLDKAAWGSVIGIRVIFVLLGVAFTAPFHAWAQQLIPSNCRYALISLGYAVGSQLLGSPTAAIALWCFQKTGMVSSVSWYWMALAIGSSLIQGKLYLDHIRQRYSLQES